MKVINFATRVVTGLRSLTMCLARGVTWVCVPHVRCMTRGWQSSVSVCASGWGEPEEPASLFCTFAESRHCNRATRQDRYLRPPTTKTAAGQRSFSFRAASLLNQMPDDARRLNPTAFGEQRKLLFFNRWPAYLLISLCVCVCVCFVFMCASIWHFTIPPVTKLYSLDNWHVIVAVVVECLQMSIQRA